nr:hypothetical protein Iba_chr04bCG3310 [Ipomoea batatas]
MENCGEVTGRCWGHHRHCRREFGGVADDVPMGAGRFGGSEGSGGTLAYVRSLLRKGEPADECGADLDGGAERVEPLLRSEILRVEKFAGMVPVPVAAMIAGSACSAAVGGGCGFLEGSSNASDLVAMASEASTSRGGSAGAAAEAVEALVEELDGEIDDDPEPDPVVPLVLFPPPKTRPAAAAWMEMEEMNGADRAPPCWWLKG